MASMPPILEIDTVIGVVLARILALKWKKGKQFH